MTFDDDCVLLASPAGNIVVACVDIGLQWPPPDVLLVSTAPDDDVQTYYRIGMSSLTDDQRAGMTRVFRGAEYLPMIPAMLLN